MCDELQNGCLPLLIPTPNGRDEAGANRDCFILNPTAKTCLHLNMFRYDIFIILVLNFRFLHYLQFCKTRALVLYCLDY